MPPDDNSPKASAPPAPANRQRMPEGWGTKLDEHGREVFFFDRFLAQARADARTDALAQARADARADARASRPSPGPANERPPSREPLCAGASVLGVRSRETDEQTRALDEDRLRALSAYDMRRPVLRGASATRRQPSPPDECGPTQGGPTERGATERGSAECETSEKLRWVFPSGLGADCAAVTSKEMTGLVLGDVTSQMDGSWDVKDVCGATRFRFCSESESKSKFNELQGEGFRWMYAQSEMMWKRHAGAILLKGKEKNDTMLTLIRFQGLGGVFLCTLGPHNSPGMFCRTEGSVRDGTFEIFCRKDPVAGVLRPEFNPSLGVREGEYVLEVMPGFNVALACSVALLVDTIQRKKNDSEEACPSGNEPAVSSLLTRPAGRGRYPAVPLAKSVLPRPPGGAGRIRWGHTMSLVLRDGLWGEDGGWDISDLEGDVCFRYRGVSEAPSGCKELWRADGHGACAATESVLLMRSAVLAMNAEYASHVLFSLQEMRLSNAEHLERETTKYLSAEGNVLDGTLVICETNGFHDVPAAESTPFARILRPEISSGSRANEGEYVLEVQPMREVDVACAIALLVDSIQSM